MHLVCLYLLSPLSSLSPSFLSQEFSEVVPGTVWSLEQLQGFINILINVRMTVVKLDEGLLVYAPLAPTREALDHINRLEAQHGPVRYLILPVSAVEHKVFFGNFASNFPDAEVWVSPGQWSWPIPLPLSLLGLGFGRRIHILGEEKAPFESQVKVATLGPFSLNKQLSETQFVETCLYHVASKSMMVTDALVYVPREPLKICEKDPYGLIFHARDRQDDYMANSVEKREEGWFKTALLALYIRPSCLDISNPNEPFIWNNWREAFDDTAERLMATPSLNQLVFRRFQPDVKRWLDMVSKWDIERVIPSHFGVAEGVSTQEVITAFQGGFVSPGESKGIGAVDKDVDNMEFLVGIDATFKEFGVVPPETGDE